MNQSYAYYTVDHDECSSDSSNKCEQNCHNTKYSYYCTCNDGYKLQPDGYNCEGKDLKSFVFAHS